MQSNNFGRMPRDGIIGDGVHINFAVRDNGDVAWAYIGTVQSGIILQYAAPGNYYNGVEHVDFAGGAWTPVYSRGNFGRNYASGGNWSGHSKALHQRIADGDVQSDEHCEALIVPGADMICLPDGMAGDIHITEVDCSMSWAIHYHTARKAMEQRLTALEIAESSLPSMAKKNLTKETSIVIANVMDVVDTYKL